MIDDEPLARYTIREALETAGHVVVEAENGNAGLGLYEVVEFDLTITDILMPDKDGVQTIKDFRLIRPGAKIIAITGGNRMRSEARLNLARSSGADGILSKPFSDDELITCVDGCLAE